MNISDTKDILKSKGFSLSYSGFEGMVLDNHEIGLRAIIWRDSEFVKFTKDYDLCDNQLRVNYKVSLDFLLEEKINPIERILDQIDLAFKKATLQA